MKKQEAIATDAESAVSYASRVLHGRFQLGEKAIAACPVFAKRYAVLFLGAKEEGIPRAPEGVSARCKIGDL